MAQKLHVNTAQTSNRELLAIARSSGFEVFNGAKHDKIKTVDGQSVTLIPRHEKISKFLAKKIVNQMNACGANISFT